MWRFWTFILGLCLSLIAFGMVYASLINILGDSITFVRLLVLLKADAFGLLLSMYRSNVVQTIVNILIFLLGILLIVIAAMRTPSKKAN